MSKWILFFVLALIFNVTMGVGYFLASNNLYDYLNTRMSDVRYTEQGLYVIPYTRITGLQVEVGLDVYENGQVVNLGTLLRVVPNYPYILFWVSMIGNFVIIVLALIVYEVNFGRLLKKMENKISRSRATSE